MTETHEPPHAALDIVSLDMVDDYTFAALMLGGGMAQPVPVREPELIREPGDEPLAAATPLPEVVAAPYVVTAPTVVASVQTAPPAEDDDIIQDDE